MNGPQLNRSLSHVWVFYLLDTSLSSFLILAGPESRFFINEFYTKNSSVIGQLINIVIIHGIKRKILNIRNIILHLLYWIMSYHRDIWVCLSRWLFILKSDDVYCIHSGPQYHEFDLNLILSTISYWFHITIITYKSRSGNIGKFHFIFLKK